MDEIAHLTERIRNGKFQDKRGNQLQLTSKEWHADLIQFIARTGVRAGELSRIRLEDIRWKERRVWIKIPKDRSNPRYLEITPGLEGVVGRLRDRSIRCGHELLVPGGMSGLTNILRRWSKRLGEPHLSARTLRHSFCTAQLSAGVPLNQVQDLMGHRSIRSTDRYVHAMKGPRLLAAAKLDTFFQPLFDTGEGA